MVLEGSAKYGHHLFLYIKSYWKSYLWLQDRAETVTGTTWPANPTIFTIWPFTEKVGQPLTSNLYISNRKWFFLESRMGWGTADGNSLFTLIKKQQNFCFKNSSEGWSYWDGQLEGPMRSIHWLGKRVGSRKGEDQGLFLKLDAL